MAANGNLIFQDTNKATFVGANSNVVIDTVNASFGVGVDVNGPTSNLHVVGNAYVTSNMEVGTANLFVDTVNSRVGIGTTTPNEKLEIYGDGIRIHDPDSSPKLDFIRGGTSRNPNTQTFGLSDYADWRITANGPRLNFQNQYTGGNSGNLLNVMTLEHDTGNVGIGTTNPSDSLHVMGAISTQNGGNPAVTPQVLFRSGPNNTNSWEMKTNVSDSFAGDFTIDRLDAGTKQKFVIKNNGNVGIGTTDPLNILHLSSGNTSLDASGSARFDEYSLIIHNTRGSGSTGTELGICFNHYDSSYPSSARTPGAAITHERTDSWSKGKLHFKTKTGNGEDSACNTRMTIDDSGNVGIGTVSPEYKLHVNGNMKFIGDIWKNWGNGKLIMNYDNNYRQGLNFNTANRTLTMFSTGASGDGGTLTFNTRSASGSNGDDIGVERMRIYPNGNVGIGTTNPTAKLEVRGPEMRITNGDSGVAQISAFGDSQGTGRLYVGQSDSYGGGIEYNGDNSPASTGAGADYTTLYRVNAGSFSWTARNVYSSNQWEFRTAINNSDDRVKENEKYIRGATETLMKIKPQLYDKKPSIESTDTKEWLCESGLIAQELYYDVPELRHLVKIPRDARDIDTNISITSTDPTVDPDYSAWGKDTSAVNYIGLVPYLIKSVQEITTELPRHKTSVSNITPQNVEDFVGMIVCKRGSVELSTRSEDKACYGVISEINCDTQNNEVLVNSCGEGKIWITNLTGNVEAGDLITTSNITGYGQLQNSPVLSNFTVAKLTEDCDFNPPSTPVRRIRQEMSNVTVYSVSREVRVTEEEYNELAEEDRTTENRITYFDGDNQIDLDTYSNLESNTLRTETTLVFKLIHRHTSRTMREGYTPEVRQELINVLDENGQMIWEDHPTETEKAYKIRYLDADGNITDEANAVHKAAFVGCTYHCG